MSSTDYVAIQNLAFEWAKCYDTKNFEGLKHILAPSVRLDFRSLGGELHDKINPHEYVDILTNMIGDKRLKTQHLLGVSKKWDTLDSNTSTVTYQIRVTHQRYEKADLATVTCKGYAHGYVTHRYRLFDGEWKIEGVEPELDFVEGEFKETLQPPEQGSRL